MAAERQKLQKALCSYTSDTLAYFATVRDFCETSSDWKSDRETELKNIKGIKERADKINLNLKHIFKSVTAVGEYMKSKWKVKSKRKKLEKKLASVLKETLGGLEKLSCFLDALEKLAVTSLYVFMENQVLHLPEEISLDDVQKVIKAARRVCPLLVEFKRDANTFFLPKLQNVGVLSYQLDKYIQTTQEILDKLEKTFLSEFDPKMNMKMVVDLDVDLSKIDVQRMLSHIDQLDKIRKDHDFRMVFLFQDEKTCSGFIRKFNERKPKMLKFLEELEDNCVQLDRMNKGAKISSIVGSSVAAVGGVLKIVGLALVPVTAGVSLGLTIGGSVMGVTSGVNSLVTTATEIGVNCKHQKKASEIFKNFVDDVQVLQDFLEEVSRRETSHIDVAVGAGKVLQKTCNVGDNIVSTTEMLKSKCSIASAGTDLAKTATNALFIGMDIFFICKESINLAKGSETEFSQFIRARAALWRSEIESWQKIHDSLSKGLPKSEKNKAILGCCSIWK